MNGIGQAGARPSPEEIRAFVEEALQQDDWRGKRVLLVVPDNTRTAPIGALFKAIHAAVYDQVAKLDVLIALGTHPPLSEDGLRTRLDLTESERTGAYRDVAIINHQWRDPGALASLGTIPAGEVAAITDGLFEMDVEVTINRRVFDYDLLCIVGPVFPHEVVGFSGGNKYLFPGISGQEIIDFFHWLGAVITNPCIIGRKHTPVRAVLDRAAGLLETPRRCFACVVEKTELAGLWYGTPEQAWDRAAEASARSHVVYHPRAYQTVLACAPAMYDDLWTGGKCMYKLEPVVADGGELIIYAPHITEVSITHGPLIERIGYHVRDYFLQQWDSFQGDPWGVLAHSTHVRGVGTFEDGVELGRIQVTLATGIPEALCRQINLGYRDPATIDPNSFRDREDEGILYVEKAGEVLHRLEDPPAWQKP